MTEKMSGRPEMEEVVVDLPRGRRRAYLVVYLVFLHHGGGGTGFGY